MALVKLNAPGSDSLLSQMLSCLKADTKEKLESPFSNPYAPIVVMSAGSWLREIRLAPSLISLVERGIQQNNAEKGFAVDAVETLSSVSYKPAAPQLKRLIAFLKRKPSTDDISPTESISLTSRASDALLRLGKEEHKIFLIKTMGRPWVQQHIVMLNLKSVPIGTMAIKGEVLNLITR